MDDLFAKFCKIYAVSNLDISYTQSELEKFGITDRIDPTAKLTMTVDSIKTIMDQNDLYGAYLQERARDSLTRLRNPAVRKAYEEYQILLKLTQEKE